jgi:hypothetical protein
MNTLSTTHRYRIVVREECADLLAGLLDGPVIESGRGWTSVVAPVRDMAELYGLLDRLQDLALHIVSLDVLEPGDDPAPVGGEQP